MWSGNEVVRPQLVDYLSGVDTVDIECGADFTFAVSENFVNYQSDYFDPQNDDKLNRRKLHYDGSPLSPSVSSRSPSSSSKNMKSKMGRNGRTGIHRRNGSALLMSGMRPRSRNKMGKMLNRIRRQKGDEVHRSRHLSNIQFPGYRQPGLPPKSAAEQRKQRAEIERIRSTLDREITLKVERQRQRQDDEHKFESFLEKERVERTENHGHGHGVGVNAEIEGNGANASNGSSGSAGKIGAKFREKSAVRKLTAFQFASNLKVRAKVKAKSKGKKKTKMEISEHLERGYTAEDVESAVSFWSRCIGTEHDFERVRHSAKLRASIWRMGVPTRLRAKVWRLAIGNELNVNQTLYSLLADRAAVKTTNDENDGDGDRGNGNDDGDGKEDANEHRDGANGNMSRLKLKPQPRSRSNSLDDGNGVNAVNAVNAPNIRMVDGAENADILGLGSATSSETASMRSISVDLPRTFPTLSYFQDDGPLNETLHSLLRTYCLFRPDRGYIQGMSYLAANLLLYMDSVNAFCSFCNLLNLPFFQCLLSLDDEQIAPRIELFNALFEHNEPALFIQFEAQFISPTEYFLDWTLSLFTKKLDIAVANRVWDCVLIFGEMHIYRAAVAILHCIHKELLRLRRENDDQQNGFGDDDQRIRKLLKTVPPTLKEMELMSAMKAVRVPKRLKQTLQKLNVRK